MQSYCEGAPGAEPAEDLTDVSQKKIYLIFSLNVCYMMYILQSGNLKIHFTSYFYVININYAS